LQSGLKIAISGKGGVGKTTVCAVWSHLFAQEGFEVLAIDADSNPNLASAFGIPSQQIPKPLVAMKELIQERTGAKSGSVGQYFKLNPNVSDLPTKYCLELGEKGLKLLILGGIERAGSGCACPESAFLKALLTHVILHRREAILVDLDAGVEFLGRASVQGIDVLVVVVEPSGRSIETANRIAQMAGAMGIERIVAIANKITHAEQIEIIASEVKDMAVLGNLSYSRSVTEIDLRGEPMIAADGLVKELTEAKDRLVNLVLAGSGNN